MRKFFLLSVSILFAAGGIFAQNEHWSRQFKKPESVTEMLPSTGMSNGVGSPTVARVKWHDGKLWFSGNWEAGVSGADPTESQLNVYWNLWTWSPVDGWEAVCYYHATSQVGSSNGPMGVINDFLWLPDGRLVVGGEFTRIENLGGIRYREVQALAVYDKDEPTANKWQPLGTMQYNGAVSAGGSVYSLAYDSQGNDLYIVGTFDGISPIGSSSQIHKYHFDTQSYEPMAGGVYKPSNPKRVDAIFIDESTTPSTIYIGGTFKWVGGDGDEPASGGTSIYSYSVASYQEGRDSGFGWKSYGENLMVAEGFMNTSMRVLDLLVDKNGDLWIAGGFAHETNADIKGIAKWDPTANSGAGDWIDPTGKQGVGREVFSMEQSSNGKIYFAGAFGGRSGTSTFYDGFNNGDDAHMAMSYDPSTGTWEELGNGLYSQVAPECRLTTNGDDVYFVGDFQYFDASTGADAANESFYVARWNETKDFTSAPIITGSLDNNNLTVNIDGGTGTWTYALDGGTAQSNNTFTDLSTGIHYVDVTNGTYSDRIYTEIKEAPAQEIAIGGDDNIHWSRRFQDPIQYNDGVMDETTGMKGSLTQSTGMEWYNDKLYFTGHLDDWFVWYYDPTDGYHEITNTFTGYPEGLKWHNDKLYVWGALGTDWKSIAVYDPNTDTWDTFNGTYDGQAVFGTGTTDGSSGVIRDLKWDSDGNMYFVGNWAFDTSIFPSDCASAVKVTTDGVYHPLGKFVSEYEPGHAKGIFTIYLDETQSPLDMYIGGTFKYARGGTLVENETYNVAKWDASLDGGNGDWGVLGVNADGDPGLPPNSFIGFEMNNSDPVVRCLTMDTDGNLYAGGSVAIYDNQAVVADRDEHFGLVKYDKSQNKWVGATSSGGVTRDIYQMTWLDNNTLLLSGSFNYGNDFQLLGNAAKLDITTGTLTALGGGLVREGLDQTIGSVVQHAVKGDEYYFFGFFDHAGINENSNVETPNSSSYIAMWDGTQNLDPNTNLETDPQINLCASSLYSSSTVTVEFTATGAGSGDTYNWYKLSSNVYDLEGTGSPWSKSVSGKPGDELYEYVSIENTDGVVGGKLPVKLNFIYKDDYNTMQSAVEFDAETNTLTSSFVGETYEWYKDGDLISGADTKSIIATEPGDYTVVVTSANGTTCRTLESEPYVISAVGIENISRTDEVSVYPNPTSGIFTIVANDDYKISVTDISGRKIKQSVIENGFLSVDLSNEAAGIYFVKYYNNTISKTVKIIKN